MKKELTQLRQEMKKRKIDAYLIPTDDFHGSEYVGDFFKCREFLSGFTGSAGTLIVMEDMAGLWTDGRYFIQAEEQLTGTGITLYKLGEPGVFDVETFLKQTLNQGACLGFDGRCLMAGYVERLENALSGKEIQLKTREDLVGLIWKNRPPMSCEDVWILEDKYAGMERNKKIKMVREQFTKQGADSLLLASLDDIAWLLNIRGNDVACTPVVLSFALISGEEFFWYVQQEAVSDAIKEQLKKDGIVLKPYESIYKDLSDDHGVLMLDKNTVNDSLYKQIPNNSRIVAADNPTVLLKAVKNPVEVENERQAHIKDGVAVTKFMYWLKKNVGKSRITEISAAEYLEEKRKEQSHYVEPSFYPIIAYKEHGAIVHYSATKDSDVKLEPKSFCLADTGGHYLEGTTDITRTFALGELTKEEITLYTTVLRGHINLAAARFLKGCTGQSLDGLARTPLWDMGLDYNHGTGHGVGYLLNVHEGPNNFRYRPSKTPGGDCILEEGMITSDEPGIYLEGKFGIRLENLIVCQKDTQRGYERFMKFEPLTMVPFDLDAVDPGLMTQKEKNWLNGYHENVFNTISSYLNDEERNWLKDATRPI